MHRALSNGRCPQSDRDSCLVARGLVLVLTNSVQPTIEAALVGSRCDAGVWCWYIHYHALSDCVARRHICLGVCGHLRGFHVSKCLIITGVAVVDRELLAALQWERGKREALSLSTHRFKHAA